MKRFGKIIAVCIVAACCLFAFAACSNKKYTVSYSGNEGADGLSAYEIWLEKGNTGSEEDFLEWLKGDNGEKGLSAYEIYLKYNPDYTGTEEEWINALTGGNLVRHTVTFKIKGQEDIVKTVFNGLDLTDIPEIPQKAFATATWDRTDFTNITEDITVKAEYATQGLEYRLNADQTTYSVFKGEMNPQTKEVFIPSTYEGKSVTGIGKKAFQYCDNLTSIEIPNSVTSIGSDAFA